MRSMRIITMLLVTMLACGCSWFGWLPWVGDGDEGEKSKDEPAELPSFDASVDVRRVWHGGVGEGLGRKYLELSPAVLADRVFTADAYGTVEARDRFNGKRVWRVRIGEPQGDPWIAFTSRRDPSFVMGGVGAGEGLVLLGTSRAEVVALSAADGTERWRTRVSSEVVSRPVATGGLVFAQTTDGRLVALDAETGAQRWSFDTQVPVLTLRGTASPVVDVNEVVAGFATGKVHAFRTDSGEPLWEQRIMLPQGRSELERMVDVDGTPLIRSGAVFAASYNGRIKALRASDGAVIWERDVSTFRDLAGGYGNVYVVDENDVIYAIDERTSEIVWEQRGLYKRELSSPIAFSNYIVVGDGEGWIHVLAQSDGRFLGRRKIDGDGVRSKCVVSEDLFYCLGNGGKLAALEIETRA